MHGYEMRRSVVGAAMCEKRGDMDGEILGVNDLTVSIRGMYWMHFGNCATNADTVSG